MITGHNEWVTENDLSCLPLEAFQAVNLHCAYVPPCCACVLEDLPYVGQVHI